MRGSIAIACMFLGACSPQNEDGSRIRNELASSASPATTSVPPEAVPQKPGATAEPPTPNAVVGEIVGLQSQVDDLHIQITDMATIATLAADTLFEFDSAKILPGAIPNLERVAALVRDGGGPVKVTGHTDAMGSDAYNMSLSQRRAAAVSEWLSRQRNIDPGRFKVVGRGESEPIAPNTLPDGGDDPAGRAKNRRVTVEIAKR